MLFSFFFFGHGLLPMELPIWLYLISPISSLCLVLQLVPRYTHILGAVGWAASVVCGPENWFLFLLAEEEQER